MYVPFASGPSKRPANRPQSPWRSLANEPSGWIQASSYPTGLPMQESKPPKGDGANNVPVKWYVAAPPMTQKSADAPNAPENSQRPLSTTSADTQRTRTDWSGGSSAPAQSSPDSIPKLPCTTPLVRPSLPFSGDRFATGRSGRSWIRPCRSTGQAYEYRPGAKPATSLFSGAAAPAATHIETSFAMYRRPPPREWIVNDTLTPWALVPVQRPTRGAASAIAGVADANIAARTSATSVAQHRLWLMDVCSPCFGSGTRRAASVLAHFPAFEDATSPASIPSPTAIGATRHRVGWTHPRARRPANRRSSPPSARYTIRFRLEGA